MKAKRKTATKAKRAKIDTTDPHAEFHRQLGVAFKAQEGAICDLMTMATITDELDDDGQQVFAIGQLRDLIEEFKKQWYDSIKTAEAVS